MMEKLVKMYQQGGITGHHLLVESLHMIDPENPELVLHHLPHEILRQMLAFIKEYQQGKMITTHRILPTIDQVEAAKQWVESQGLTHRLPSQQTDPATVRSKPSLPES